MTATDEAPVETVENEAPVFPDEMAKMSYDLLTNLINERNVEVAKINAAKGDQQTLMENLRESSTNPEAVALREKIAEYQEALDEAVLALDKVVRPEVQELMESAGDTKGAEEKIREHDDKIKPGLAYFKKMYGENLAKHLPSLQRLRGFSTKGAGSSGRRVRGYSVEVTVEGDEPRNFENLASAAKYLEVDTVQVQNAFFEAAGNPEKLKDAPNRVDFNIEVTETDEDGNTETTTASLVATRDEANDSNESE